MAFRLRSSGQKTIGNLTLVAKPNFTQGLLPTQVEINSTISFEYIV